MPDYTGVLTQEERIKFGEWSNSKWRMGHCPVCGQSKWELQDHIISASVWTSIEVYQIAPNYPHVMVSCGNCGYTLFINAITAGILPRIGGT